MQRTVVATVVVVSALVAVGFGGDVKVFAGARFDGKTWAKLQKIDVRTLSGDATMNAHVGQLMELHFNFRSKDVRHIKPNWYEAAVWQDAPEGRRGFVSVPVMIAKDDVEAFNHFTTDPKATQDLKIYGQVLYDFGMNFVFVRVIGTSTMVDGDGYTVVMW